MKSSWIRKAMIGAAAGVVAGATIAVPAEAATAYTTAPVNLRTGTSLGSTLLDTVPGDTTLNVECQAKGDHVAGTYNSDWWAKIEYNGQSGYVSRAYVRVPAGQDVPTCADEGGDVTPWTPHEIGAPISRELVLARAQYWVDQGVPYNWDISAPDPQGTYYRQDCSGMVAMALHLSWSPSTVTLTDYVHAVNKGDLRPGDLVGNLGPGTGGAAGHVVVFNGWVPGTNQTQFYSIEQQGGVGSVAQVRNWGDSNWNQQGWRYNNISN